MTTEQTKDLLFKAYEVSTLMEDSIQLDTPIYATRAMAIVDAELRLLEAETQRKELQDNE